MTTVYEKRHVFRIVRELTLRFPEEALAGVGFGLDDRGERESATKLFVIRKLRKWGSHG